MKRIIFKSGLLVICFSFCNASLHGAMRNLVGVRALGMGGAFTSLAKETSSLYWNPAGLGDMNSREITGMFSSDAIDNRYAFVSYGQPVPSFGGMAFGWSRFSNVFEKTDLLENVLGSGEIINDEFMAGASYCQGLPVSAGVTIKYISEKIDNFSLSGLALDSGLLYDVEPLCLAFVAENILSSGLRGNSVNSGSVEERLPTTLRFGFSYSGKRSIELDPALKSETVHLRTNTALDIVMPLDSPEGSFVSPGLEVWINDFLALRTGVRALKDFTAGVSLKSLGLAFDYAFINSQNLENSHVFSTSIFF